MKTIEEIVNVIENDEDWEEQLIDTRFAVHKDGVFICPIARDNAFTAFPNLDKRDVRRLYRKFLKAYNAKEIKVLYTYNKMSGQYFMTTSIQCRCCKEVRGADHDDTNEIKQEWVALLELANDKGVDEAMKLNL